MRSARRNHPLTGEAARNPAGAATAIEVQNIGARTDPAVMPPLGLIRGVQDRFRDANRNRLADPDELEGVPETTSFAGA